jgi:prenyl protein peptidase
MGYKPVGMGESLKSLLLTAALFAGPLYETLILDGVWEEWLRLQPLKDIWTQWTSWRNIVVVSQILGCR